VTGRSLREQDLLVREQAVLAREQALQSRERALAAKEQALSQQPSRVEMAADTDVEQLIGRMRQANEHLAVATVNAQYASDAAMTDAASARRDLDLVVQELSATTSRMDEVLSTTRGLEAQVRQREEDYEELSSRMLQLQDDERRRLAVDLHDSTAQYLAALSMNLDLLDQSDLDGLDIQLRRVLTESRLLAESCAREVRTLAYLLHTPLLEERGLVSAVRSYVQGFTERSHIRVHLDADELARLPQPIEMGLFRVVQESLTNIHRHASTAMASIRIATAAHTVTLEIHDRGHGLRKDLTQGADLSSPAVLGVGIQGMRERIRQLGGTFEVVFTAKGTTVRATVPRGE
jgi:signal transduction histidine kinase